MDCFFHDSHLYGLSLTRSHYEAEDLVQEALYRFLLIYDQLEDTNYKAWLFRVMRNYYFDKQRKGKKKPTIYSINLSN
ncbi:RNA polymerase sigma factor [Enterococcus saccharolyticus]|uniref:RNA polymerase sigma factor n=1 Tax=Enterococcus saccharolyticus TaxID=41997 RepID=UPI0039E130C5